jgi:hypothetical protein
LGSYLVIVKELTEAPIVAVSKGLSSEAIIYIVYVPSYKPVQAIYELEGSFVLYERILKCAGGSPLGPEPFLISLISGARVHRVLSPIMM